VQFDRSSGFPQRRKHLQLLRLSGGRGHLTSLGSAAAALLLRDPNPYHACRAGPNGSTTSRAAREVRKFQSDAGMTGEAANAPGLHKRLFAAARAAGYVKRNRNGQEVLTVGVPSMVDLFNRYDQQTVAGMPAWLYRFLSGYAHGREWVMLRGASEANVEGFDTTMNIIRADQQLLCYLAERTVAVVERAVAIHADYRADT
jgi:hypothetical protein